MQVAVVAAATMIAVVVGGQTIVLAQEQPTVEVVSCQPAIGANFVVDAGQSLAIPFTPIVPGVPDQAELAVSRQSSETAAVLDVTVHTFDAAAGTVGPAIASGRVLPESVEINPAASTPPD